MMNLFKPRTTGLDLGSRTIKGIQLSRKRGRIHMDRYFYVDLSKERPADYGSPEPTEVLQSLKALVEIHRLKNARVSSALKDELVYSFDLLLPEMPQADLKAAVVHEVASQLRKQDEELVVDFFVDGEQPGPEGKLLKVRAYCSEKIEIEKHMRMISEAGLRPYSIESEMQAAIETLRFNEYINDNTTCCVVSIGDKQTMISFVLKGNLISTKIERIGLGAINQALQGRLGVNFEEAEKRKLAYRFSDDPAVTTPEQEVIEEVIFQISKAIKESLESFLDGNVGEKIENIYLIGGGSRYPKLDAVLQSFFGIPTSVPNPFKNIEIYSTENSAEQAKLAEIAGHMTTAVGLALRNLT